MMKKPFTVDGWLIDPDNHGATRFDEATGETRTRPISAPPKFQKFNRQAKRSYIQAFWHGMAFERIQHKYERHRYKEPF